mmetsp:Transcript_49571/g.158602  ORF Transcript_49571/g.158602 Transcript_49571/m.158602 type:complete len:397 (-) Transcript_49571:27-1217(-)
MDGPHGPEEAGDGQACGGLHAVYFVALEALEVRPPLLVVVEPRRDQGDVALGRVGRDVRCLHGLLAEGAPGTVLALHPRARDEAVAVLAALPALECKVPAAPTDAPEARRLEVLEVLGVVAGRRLLWVEPRGRGRGDEGQAVAQAPQHKVQLVQPRHPEQAARADRVEVDLLADGELGALLLHVLVGAEKRGLLRLEMPQQPLLAELVVPPQAIARLLVVQHHATFLAGAVHEGLARGGAVALQPALPEGVQGAGHVHSWRRSLLGHVARGAAGNARGVELVPVGRGAAHRVVGRAGRARRARRVGRLAGAAGGPGQRIGLRPGQLRQRDLDLQRRAVRPQGRRRGAGRRGRRRLLPLVTAAGQEHGGRGQRNRSEDPAHGPRGPAHLAGMQPRSS